MAITMCVYNLKGGIGKSTGTFNIAGQLALNGKKVLTIDGDIQQNLTQLFFENIPDELLTVQNDIFEDGELRKGVDTLYHVLEGETNVYDAIRSVEFTSRRKLKNKFKKKECKVDVLVGSKDMKYFGCEDFNILKEKLTVLQDEYDYIIIDTPPNYNAITMMYLLASDYVLIPMHLAKSSSLHAYSDVINAVKEAREDYGNKNLTILGSFYMAVQLYKNDQKEFHEYSMNKEISESMSLFKTSIRYDYSSTRDSENAGKPLCICCASTDIAKDYEKLVKEIEKRIKEEENN